MHEKTPFQWTGLAGKLGAVVALCLLPDPYWFDGAAHAAPGIGFHPAFLSQAGNSGSEAGRKPRLRSLFGCL